jgi:hypothetical protein
VAIAVRLEGFISVGPSSLEPRAGDIVTHVIAAAPNRRTENDVNVVGARAKGGGHDRQRCASNVHDGSPPTGVGNADGGPTTSGTGIDDQHRLAVGMQGHQHRAALVRHQCIAESDLNRSRSGAVSGVRLRGEVDIPSVNLTQRDQVFRFET